MSEYVIHWVTSASAWTEVEADSLDEAMEASYELLPGSICHQCASKVEVGDDWTETYATCDGEEVPVDAS